MDIHPDWWESDRLIRVFRFPNFKTALDFASVVGTIVEDHRHYPNIEVSWGKVSITLWTHGEGITEIDYKVAKKIDKEYYGLQSKIF